MKFLEGFRLCTGNNQLDFGSDSRIDFSTFTALRGRRFYLKNLWMKYQVFGGVRFETNNNWLILQTDPD